MGDLRPGEIKTLRKDFARLAKEDVKTAHLERQKAPVADSMEIVAPLDRGPRGATQLVMYKGGVAIARIPVTSRMLHNLRSDIRWFKSVQSGERSRTNDFTPK